MSDLPRNGLSDLVNAPGRRFRACDSFDEALIELLCGPNGASLRRRHLFDQIAITIFDGDFEKAKDAMVAPHPALGWQSPSEAAETHEGMISVKKLIAKSARSSSSKRGIGALLDAFEDAQRREFEPLLDLLPAAWQLSAEQFASVLGSSPPSISDWQCRSIELTPEVIARLSRLRRFQETVRAAVEPENYREVWHTVWTGSSPIGTRSLWEAYQTDGDLALDAVEGNLRRFLPPF